MAYFFSAPSAPTKINGSKDNRHVIKSEKKGAKERASATAGGFGVNSYVNRGSVRVWRTTLGQIDPDQKIQENVHMLFCNISQINFGDTSFCGGESDFVRACRHAVTRYMYILGGWESCAEALGCQARSSRSSGARGQRWTRYGDAVVVCWRTKDGHLLQFLSRETGQVMREHENLPSTFFDNFTLIASLNLCILYLDMHGAWVWSGGGCVPGTHGNPRV